MASFIDKLLDETDTKMTKAVDAMKRDFAGVRTGKASPALVENLQVEYYGTSVRLRDIAGITEKKVFVSGPCW